MLQIRHNKRHQDNPDALSKKEVPCKAAVVADGGTTLLPPPPFSSFALSLPLFFLPFPSLPFPSLLFLSLPFPSLLFPSLLLPFPLFSSPSLFFPPPSPFFPFPLSPSPFCSFLLFLPRPLSSALPLVFSLLGVLSCFLSRCPVSLSSSPLFFPFSYPSLSFFPLFFFPPSPLPPPSFPPPPFFLFSLLLNSPPFFSFLSLSLSFPFLSSLPLLSPSSLFLLLYYPSTPLPSPPSL